MAIDPSAIIDPPISQIPLSTIDPIMELAEATVVVHPCLSDVPYLGKRKGKELIMGTHKRPKRKVGA